MNDIPETLYDIVGDIYDKLGLYYVTSDKDDEIQEYHCTEAWDCSVWDVET